MEDIAPFDDQVAQGVRAGEPDALAAVYRALVGPLVAWLRAQAHDPHLAEDVAEDTFLDLVRDCRRLTGGPHQIRAWLYRAARRNLLDHHRRCRRRPEELASADRAASGPGPAEQVVDRDVARRLRAALGLLSPDQRQVLTLRFLGELSAPEVAAVLGRSEGAVRALQHRGVAAMARLIRGGTVPVALVATPQPVEPQR